jgi:hypothetical protein
VLTPRVAKAGGTDAAFIAGHSTASWPSNSTNRAPMKASQAQPLHLERGDHPEIQGDGKTHSDQEPAAAIRKFSVWK